MALQYSESAIVEITWYQVRSMLFLNNHEAHWQRHLKGTLQLNILLACINICANFFLCKYHEMKTHEGALEIISCTEFRDCS